MKSPRRDQLKSLLLGAQNPQPEPGTDTAAPSAPEQKSVPRIRSLLPDRPVSGSVRAMSRSLNELGAAAEEATRLRAQLDGAAAIVDIDPALIDPSFVLDRLDDLEQEEGRAFLADIAAHGQQSPVLVRPHPDAPGRYQIAYGHRRLWAAGKLGIAVKAQVRPLSDVELVIAQGQENAQRRDLSFIEKAKFALALDARGFDRQTLMAALAVQTAEVTRLIGVARLVPAELIDAIGPAPKAGRPRWMALAEAVKAPDAQARALRAAVSAPATLDSDGRFARAYAAATARPAAERDESIVLKQGAYALVRLKGQGVRAVLAFEERAFAEYLATRMRPLYREWLKLQDRSEEG